MAPLVLERSAREQLADAYAQAKGPFSVSIDGQQDFVVMSTSDFEGYCEPPLSDAEIRSLKQGYDEAMRGELYDAQEMLAEIRAEYGI